MIIKPYDILLHQTLSIVKERSGVLLLDLIKQIKNNKAFSSIEIAETTEIINHLIENNILEKIRNEVIIGIEGEKIVNNRDFYSVFKTEENFKVIYAGKTIGEVPFSLQIIEDANILLAARIWKIKFIDQKSKKIDVIPANDGKKPVFFGNGGVIHSKIREKMLEVLFTSDEYNFLDQPCCEVLKELRKDFSIFRIANIQIDRPLLEKERRIQFFSFTGTKTNRTIKLIFDILGVTSNLNDNDSSFVIEDSKENLLSKIKQLSMSIPAIDTGIANCLKINPSILSFSKWGYLLPEKYKIIHLRNKYFDINKTVSFLNNINIKININD